VIKAAGLFIHLQCLTGLSHRQRSVDSREDIYPQKTAACRTGNQGLGIGRFFVQRRVAMGAVKHEKSFAWQLKFQAAARFASQRYYHICVLACWGNG
jgi:hypothetical protein